MALDETAQRRTVQQLLDMFVEPEIIKRQDAGEVENPFPLTHAQIIFYPDGRKPEVRLNDEVKTIINVELKPEFRDGVKKGDPVYWHQIESLKTTRLTEEDDPNVGHATLLSVGGNWFLHFDFVYNKQRARQHLEAARQFIASAKHALENEHWAVVIESLCSASELTAKAYLLSAGGDSALKSKTHGVIASRTNMHRKLGNLDSSHVDVFNRVWGMRNNARYLEGELALTQAEAQEYIIVLEEFAEDVGICSKADV